MRTYQIIRSNRKTISLEIRPDLSLLVRAPRRASEASIRSFVQQKESWIDTHLARMREQQENLSADTSQKLTPLQLQALAREALGDLPARARRYAPIVGVSYGRITIRSQRTRWGSCSAKGNLNFNCLLMLAPESVRDYVVVHELCHRLQMNHSPRFWAEVERVMPDYRQQREWLKQHGNELMAQNPAG